MAATGVRPWKPQKVFWPQLCSRCCPENSPGCLQLLVKFYDVKCPGKGAPLAETSLNRGDHRTRVLAGAAGEDTSRVWGSRSPLTARPLTPSGEDMQRELQNKRRLHVETLGAQPDSSPGWTSPGRRDTLGAESDRAQGCPRWLGALHGDGPASSPPRALRVTDQAPDCPSMNSERSGS